MREKNRDLELLSIIKQLRVGLDDTLRIVFFCERPTNDPLLARLVSMGVLDIFHNQRIDIDQFTTQLKGKVPFSSVERFLNYSLAIAGEPIPTLIEEKEVEKKQK